MPIVECTCTFSNGTPVCVVLENKRTRLSKNDKVRLLLEKLSGSYPTQEIIDLYKKE